jgi:hypothetical protein
MLVAMRPLALAAAVAASVAFAGAVGGASKQTSAEARYALEVEAWCGRWWTAYAALGEPETMAEWASRLVRTAPLVAEQEQEFARLRPPASYRSQAARISAHMEDEKPIARQMLAAAGRGDERAFERLVAGLEPSGREWNDAMRRIGAYGCAASPTA